MTTTTVTSPPTSPFHAGETAVQERLGVRENVAGWAPRMIRPYLNEQLREFFPQLPWVIAAARDEAGRPWVSLLTGDAGFASSPEPTALALRTRPLPGDALEAALRPGAGVGLLGIDLKTRRRNRVNGRLAATVDDGLLLEVGQAFGNCPQYIVERSWYAVTDAERTPSVHRGSALEASDQAWIRAADTLFLGSGVDSAGDDDVRHGLDASHRGGSPGFVHVVDATHFVIPDYAGNNLYNSIGNLVVDPRIAVTFVDFAAGSVLQVSGHAEVDFEPAADPRFPGAQRLIHVHVDAMVRLDDALPMRWHAPEGAVREFKVVARVSESDDVTSFHLRGRDAGPVPDFEPGQHLPLQLPVAGGSTVKRSYSLSGGPDDDHLRISVKREPEGLVSGFLHDRIEVGEVLLVSPPAGDFAVAPGERPVALIAAGIGVTPMTSMLRGLVARGDGRPVLFAHGVRDGAHHPFADEVRELLGAHGRGTGLVAYSRPRPEDDAGIDFDHAGRLDVDLVVDRLGTLDADYYLCGPAAFVADLTAGLVERGVDERRIRSETF